MALSSKKEQASTGWLGREKDELKIDWASKPGIEFEALQETQDELETAVRQSGRKPSS